MLLLSTGLLACVTSQPGPDIAPLPASSGEDPSEAARAWLGLLSPEERGIGVLEFSSPEREAWSTLPANVFGGARPGLRFGDMTEEQLAASLDLVDTLTSDGAATVRQIIAADNVLQRRDFRSRGWSTANYWLALYGDPTVPPWGYSLQGHRLALNVSIDDDGTTISPSFFGAEPTSFQLEDETYEPLGPVVDSVIVLVDALTPEQLQMATIADPGEILAGPGRDRRLPDIEGIDAGRLSGEQQTLLLDLVRIFTETTSPPSPLDVGGLHFAWSGTGEGSGPAYFRIQGSDLLLEFSSNEATSRSGAHHAVFRVPSTDYGR